MTRSLDCINSAISRGQSAPVISSRSIDFFTPVSCFNREKSFLTWVKEAADDYFDYGLKDRAFVVQVEGSTQKVNLLPCKANLYTTILKIASLVTVLLPIFALIIKGIARWDASFRVVQPDEVPAQPAVRPLGLQNTGNSCWLNSSLQLLIHIPAFQARLRQIPAFESFLCAYGVCRNSFQRVAFAANFDLIRQHLSAQTNGQISIQPTQQDAAQVFDCLFEGPNALYTFEQRINGNLSANQVEPMIRVAMEGQDLQQMFNVRFDYHDDLGRHIQQFFPNSPNDLLIQVKRFYHHRDTATETWHQIKNNQAINVPLRMSIPSQFIRTGEARNYSCDGFVVHHGESLNEGHYVAYLKVGNAWWHVSDAAVHQVTEAKAQLAMRNGYIFHYAA